MRLALYAVPACDDPLYRLGAALLGYNAATGTRVPFPPHGTFATERWSQLTDAPRRYGFHATLKAPFEVAAGVAEADVAAAVAALAATLAPVDVGPLEVSHARGFLALRPRTEAGTAAARTLATRCVEALDHCRAPLSQADRARHLAKGLTARQRANLDRWGYPYVGADAELHLTLSDRVDGTEAAHLSAAILAVAADVPLALTIDALVLCRQADRNAPFTIVARIPLGGSHE
jgi:hypothetical protein